MIELFISLGVIATLVLGTMTVLRMAQAPTDDEATVEEISASNKHKAMEEHKALRAVRLKEIRHAYEIAKQELGGEEPTFDQILMTRDMLEGLEDVYGTDQA